jgi:hypothetical protein
MWPNVLRESVFGGQQVLVAESEGAVVGYASFTERSARHKGPFSLSCPLNRAVLVESTRTGHSRASSAASSSRNRR